MVNVGDTFSRLTVVRSSPTTGKVRWVCKCACGQERVVLQNNLVSGISKSCGCGRFKVAKGKRGVTTLLSQYKSVAKIRGFEFHLTMDIFESLTSSACEYCGVPPRQTITPQNHGKKLPNERYVYNGIDRVDNSKGYTADNCVPCCGDCNFAKEGKSYSDWRAWIERIISHNQHSILKE